MKRFSLKKFSIIFIASLCLFLVVSFLFWKIENKNAGFPSEVQIGNSIVKVHLAIDAKAKEEGLSVFSSLPKDEGMLFVFDKPDQYSFWMKNMKFPIDIIWINGDFRIVYLQKNAKPDSYPDIFTPDEPALYVLEVPAGFADEKKVKVSNEVKFLR